MLDGWDELGEGRLCAEDVLFYIYPEYVWLCTGGHVLFSKIPCDSQGLSPKITVGLIHLQEVAYTRPDVLRRDV